MSKRSMHIYGIGTTKRNVPLATLMWGMFALLFSGFGILPWFTHGRIEWFLTLFGLVAAIFAIISYRRYKQLQLNC